MNSSKDNFNIKTLELEAINALKDKDYPLAEDIYLKLVSINQNSKEYNNNLANIYLILQNTNLAIKYYQKALSLDNNFLNIENQSIAYNLACAYQINNDLDNTIKYLALTLEINQNHKSALAKIENLKDILINESLENKNYYNLAVIFHKLKQYQEAEKYYLLDLQSNSTFESNYNLGSIYHKLKNYEKALKYYQQSNLIKPNKNTEYLINSIKENNKITKPPKEYVSSLFDYYSDNYENDLINNLSYKVPEYFFEIFKKNLINKHENFKVLDLGCGTGLVGQKFKILSHKISSIIGTDLSKKMIKIAENKNIYDNFFLEDINDSLNNREIILENINLITAADVLVYLGDLERVFHDIKKNFQNCYFLFSCENNNEIIDYKLTKTGRYQHSENYIEGLIKKYNFDLILSEHFQLRKNESVPVNGSVYLIKI